MPNKQHLPLLREARRLIEEGHERMICFAVSAACSGPGSDDWLLAAQITDFVEAAIGQDATLVSWVRLQMKGRHPLPAALHTPATECRIDAATRGQRDLMRMAWIDKIIYDIEAQP